jgi:hypothetical protein
MLSIIRDAVAVGVDVSIPKPVNMGAPLMLSIAGTSDVSVGVGDSRPIPIIIGADMPITIGIGVSVGVGVGVLVGIGVGVSLGSGVGVSLGFGVGVSVGIGVGVLVNVVVGVCVGVCVGVWVGVGVLVSNDAESSIALAAPPSGGPPPNGRDNVSVELYGSVFDDVISAVL